MKLGEAGLRQDSVDAVSAHELNGMREMRRVPKVSQGSSSGVFTLELKLCLKFGAVIIFTTHKYYTVLESRTKFKHISHIQDKRKQINGFPSFIFQVCWVVQFFGTFCFMLSVLLS